MTGGRRGGVVAAGTLGEEDAGPTGPQLFTRFTP